jgi:arylsulfatase A-like enzyme
MNLTLRNSLVSAMAGFFVGIGEGAFLFFLQRPIIDHSVGPAIFIIAPLLDGIAFGLLGACLGSIVKICRHSFPPRWGAAEITLGLATAGAYLTFLPAHAWVRSGKYQHLAIIGIAVLGGVIMAVTVTISGRFLWQEYMGLGVGLRARLLGAFRRAALISVALLLSWVLVRLVMAVPPPRAHARENGPAPKPPNIILIALDAAGTDHISAYGYPKPTTPNLDNLAKQGILFENAVAPAPWTLPSFAAVFTGLLPHQNGTTWETPLPNGFATLASILGSRGYQTAGFNANHTYGTARTGLAQGFNEYDDDDGTFLTDLGSIGFVKLFSWVVYYPFIRADYFPRRDAHALNQDIVLWAGHCGNEPFFLFVNYFDAHEPYSPIADIGNRFGYAKRSIAQRIRSEMNGRPLLIEAPRSPAEQDALIAGYDSGIAYADSQIGNLLHLLETSPESSNTYVIVFGDHGQTFGSHRHYGHGWGLNFDLLHVPLIIAGPKIPEGRVIKGPVSLQQLYATVLDISNGGDAAVVEGSLRCSWGAASAACGPTPLAISELAAGDSSSISLVMSGMHLIRNSAGDLHLFDLTNDPKELVDLADATEYSAEVNTLQNQLFRQIQTSSTPWRGEEYLWALGKQNYSSMARQRLVRTAWPTTKSVQGSTQEDELLHSLPYQ